MIQLNDLCTADFFLFFLPSPIWYTLGYLCTRCVPYANTNQQVLTKLIKVKTSRLNFVSHNENRSAGGQLPPGAVFHAVVNSRCYACTWNSIRTREWIWISVIMWLLRALELLSRSFLFIVFNVFRSRSERRKDVTIGIYGTFKDTISLRKIFFTIFLISKVSPKILLRTRLIVCSILNTSDYFVERAFHQFFNVRDR